MLDIIQGEKQPWSITIFKKNADGTRSFLPLTGNVEITVCFTAGVIKFELTRVAGGRVTVDSELEGKISGFLNITETTAMPEVNSGTVEVAVDFGSGDVQKSIILDALKVTATTCTA